MNATAHFDFAAAPTDIRIERAPGSTWNRVFLGTELIGGFGRTTRDTPGMEYYWSAVGTWGHCSREADALAAVREQIPTHLGYKAEEAWRNAEFAALSPELQGLKAASDAADYRRNAIFGSNPFDAAGYHDASAECSRAYGALLAAQARRAA